MSVMSEETCIFSLEDRNICEKNKAFAGDPLNSLVRDVYKKTFIIIEDIVSVQDAVCLLYQKKYLSNI